MTLVCSVDKYIQQFGKIYVEVCTNTFYNLDKSTCVLDKYSLDKYIHCIIWPNILSTGISYQREVDAAPLREGIMTTGPGASLPPKESKNMLKFFCGSGRFGLLTARKCENLNQQESRLLVAIRAAGSSSANGQRCRKTQINKSSHFPFLSPREDNPHPLTHSLLTFLRC